MRFLKSILFILLLSNTVIAQSYNKFQKDFIQLTKIVHGSYPLSDSANIKLMKLEPQLLLELKKCDNNDCFRITAQKYMAQLNDGHSKIHCYQAFTRKGHHPIRFNFINEKLYISNYPNTIPDQYIGKQVVAINGVEIPEIENRAKTYISADNDISLRNHLRWLLNKPTFYEFIGIDTDSVLKLELSDGSQLHWVRDIKEKGLYVRNNDIAYPIDTLKLVYYEKKENDLTGWSNNLFEYKILKESNTCYFKFRECYDIQWLNDNPKAFKPFPKWIIKIFWYFRGGKFTKFISKMFTDIEKTKVDNLVIDLRENTGGTSILGYQLLDYLMDIENLNDYSETIVLSELLKKSFPNYFNDIVKNEAIKIDSLPIFVNSNNNDGVKIYLRDKKSHYYQAKPKIRFKGDVYVMVGNETFSSAAMIAVLLADNNLAKVVGNPMGIGASHNGEVLDFILTNTDTKGIISCKKFYRPSKNNNLTKELNIDIKVTNTELNTFKGIDEEFKKLLLMINNNKPAPSVVKKL